MFSGFGRRDVVEYLLQSGANVHARDDGGLIPLHNACSFGHAEVVNLLLRHGADPNARDNWNYTPLHEAAIKGKIDVCIGNFLSSNCYDNYFFSLFCFLVRRQAYKLTKAFKKKLFLLYSVEKQCS